jgi:hypothetical protein
MDSLHDFANTPGAPHFEAATIRRRARRKGAVGIAGVAAGVAVACGGVAFAVTGGGSTAPRSTEGATAVAASSSSTPTRAPKVATGARPGTVVVREGDWNTTIQVGGLRLDEAKKVLARAGLTVGRVRTERLGPYGGAGCSAAPGTVIAGGPAPYRGWVPVLTKGSKVDLTVCQP